MENTRNLPTIEDLREQLLTKPLNDVIEILGQPHQIVDGTYFKELFFKNVYYCPFRKLEMGLSISIATDESKEVERICEWHGVDTIGKVFTKLEALINKEFCEPFLPEGHVKAIYNEEKETLTLHIGRRDVEFNRYLIVVGSGTEVPHE